MNNSSKAQVIEKQTQEVLFECEVSEIEKAYKYASDMEAIDLEVEVRAPGLPQTLIDQLGMDEAQSHKYRQSLKEEIESHEDDSCCYKNK